MQFNEFTRRLYELLKACHNECDYAPDSTLCKNVETALGDYERIEILKEPLPPFAIGVNLTRTIGAGVQLLTRNGAVIGNAFIVGFRVKFANNTWACITEAGNRMNLTSEEIHELFTIGPYLCDPKEVETKYGGRQQLRKNQ